MAIFGFIFFVVALVLIGVGIGLGLMAVAIATVLLGLGVVSSSFVVGLGTRRPAWGIRVFLLQIGLLAGVPAGAIGGWLAQFLLGDTPDWLGVVYGALGGAVAGIAVALMLDFLIHRFQRWVAIRMVVSRPLNPPIRLA